MELVLNEQNLIMRLGMLFVGLGALWLATFPMQNATLNALAIDAKSQEDEINIPLVFRAFRLFVLVMLIIGTFTIMRSYGPRNNLIADTDMSRDTSTDIVKNVTPPKQRQEDQFIEDEFEQAIDKVINDALRGTTQ